MLATENEHIVDEELVATRRAMWSSFIKFSTYAIVGIALVLILLALFFL